MARIDEHPDITRAEAAGKVPPSVQAPWDSFSPQQLSIEHIRSAARSQLAGGRQMSMDELREAVARLVLGGG